MPLYTVLPSDQSFASAEIEAPDPARVFNIVERLECQEADVLQDGEYAFSIRLSTNGIWNVFQRDDTGAVETIPPYG